MFGASLGYRVKQNLASVPWEKPQEQIWSGEEGACQASSRTNVFEPGRVGSLKGGQECGETSKH